MDDLDRLQTLVAAGDVLVLTGAGVSTDSGIPDYRDATGRMRHRAPMTYDVFTGSASARRHYWARSHVAWPRVASARPNLTHRTIADLERRGLLTGVVTQNVDGLHERAGTDDVIALHGRLDRVVCLGCGDRTPRVAMGLRLDVVNPGFRERADAIRLRADGDAVLSARDTRDFLVVDCRRCGGVLKPDVVFFGEHVPRDRFRGGLARLDASSALLVLGTSLAVGSGYRFVTAARRRGLPVAIVTRGRTRGDAHATLRLDTELGLVMPALVASPGQEATQPPPADEGEQEPDEGEDRVVVPAVDGR